MKSKIVLVNNVARLADVRSYNLTAPGGASGPNASDIGWMWVPNDGDSISFYVYLKANASITGVGLYLHAFQLTK